MCRKYVHVSFKIFVILQKKIKFFYTRNFPACKYYSFYSIFCVRKVSSFTIVAVQCPVMYMTQHTTNSNTVPYSVPQCTITSKYVVFHARPLVQQKLDVLGRAGLSKDNFSDADTRNLKVFFFICFFLLQTFNFFF